jgi:hypothetical protein
VRQFDIDQNALEKLADRIPLPQRKDVNSSYRASFVVVAP